MSLHTVKIREKGNRTLGTVGWIEEGTVTETGRSREEGEIGLFSVPFLRIFYR